MIKADIHTHTNFSSDCETQMEALIETAIRKGLQTLCFTEHMDKDYPNRDPKAPLEFCLDIDSYRTKYLEMKEKYAGRIELLCGVELGLQPHIVDWNKDYVNHHDYLDFVIGSAHTIGKKDPYYATFFEGRSEREAYNEYFDEALLDISLFDDFDSFGHFDYVVRYGPNRNRDYSYRSYSDRIDPILKLLIEKGIALEVNSAGYRKGLGEPNPSKDVILRYKELGGELVTIGSDAHTTDSLCSDFDAVEALLLECGFSHHAVYKNRKPVFYPLG